MLSEFQRYLPKLSDRSIQVLYGCARRDYLRESEQFPEAVVTNHKRKIGCPHTEPLGHIVQGRIEPRVLDVKIVGEVADFLMRSNEHPVVPSCEGDETKAAENEAGE